MNLVYSLINHVFCHNSRCIFYIMIIFDISLSQIYIISFCKYAMYQLKFFSFGVVSLINTLRKSPDSLIRHAMRTQFLLTSYTCNTNWGYHWVLNICINVWKFNSIVWDLYLLVYKFLFIFPLPLVRFEHTAMVYCSTDWLKYNEETFSHIGQIHYKN